MERLEKYSLIDLINKYRNVIGDEIADIIISSIIPNNNRSLISEFKNSIRDAIDNSKKIIPNGFPKEKNREIILNAVYNRVIYMLETADFENIEAAKKDFLMEVYRKFSSVMPKKQKQELTDLILGNNESVIYSFYSNEYPGVIDAEIISREKPKKLLDIKNQEEREILEIALAQAGRDGYVQALLKEEYYDIYAEIVNKMAADLIKKGELTLEEYEKMFERENDDYYEEIEEKLDREEIEFFKENFQFINEEFLVLNLAARIMLGIKIDKGEDIDGICLNEEVTTQKQEEKQISMEYSISLLKRLYKYLSANRFKDEEFVIRNDEDEVVIISNKAKIKEFIDRCTSKEYFTDEEIEMIHQELLEGIIPEDLEERKVAGLNKDDLLKLLEINKEDIENILPVAIELAEYLRQIEQFSDEEILEAYLDGNLPLELITEIEMENLSEEGLSQKLRETYFEVFIKDNEKEEEKEKLKRATRLAKLFNSYDEFDKDKVIERILDTSDSESIDKTIADLKKIGLINLEETIEFTGIDILLREYSEGSLKPAEVRKCYEKGKIDLDNLAELIRKLPDNSEKFMLIGSIFPEEQDADTREILIFECMKLEGGLNKSKTGNKREAVSNGEGQNYNQHITDPFARLSLIQVLDECYSFEMTVDGHAIIVLPNLEKVIIEKMLDREGEPSYGSATYILSEEYYYRNHINIIEDGKIRRSRIAEDIGLGEVDRIVHGVESWGKKIKKYFKTDEPTRYSQEDRAKIDKIIERIKRSSRIKE